MTENCGWHFNWIEEWSQFAGGCNWYTFTPIKLEFEDDRHMGGVEVTAILLGLGFCIRWNHTETDEVRKLRSMVDDITAGRVETIEWPSRGEQKP